MTAPKVYTRPEAAELLRIGMTKLDELIKSGELPARRVGRRVLISETSITAYLSGDTQSALTAA